MNRVELLSPAGSKESFYAAIASGADAVYFGLENFNARIRAENIQLKDLSELTKIAKSNNVRCYLTINTLVFDDEFESLLCLVNDAIKNGIDAVIVQDLGVLNLLHTVFPELELHASTQLTTHNKAQCDFLKTFNVSQINVSRELSLLELKDLNQHIALLNIKSEVFIHGAFCISWSGQCYFSRALYEEPGNRGKCVQPCRRFYSTGKLFIPCFNLKDNNAYSLTKELIDCGANSLKIEGRIKNAEYVYAITSAWKEQLDRFYSNKKLLLNDNRLERVMNRNFSDGYLRGEISKEQFHNGSKDESIKYVGSVVKYTAESQQLHLSLNTELEELSKNADILIKEKNDDFVCTAIIKKTITKDLYELIITNKIRNRILPGQKVYYRKPVIEKDELAQLTNKIKNIEEEKVLLNIRVCGKIGQKLLVSFLIQNDVKEVTFESSVSIQTSEKNHLSKETLSEKLGRLGNTEFKLNDIDISELENSGKNMFIPLSELNELRRKAVDALHSRLESCSVNVNNSKANEKDFNQIKREEFQKVLQTTKKEKPLQREYAFLFSTIIDLVSFKNIIEKKLTNCIYVLELSLDPSEKEIQLLLEDERIIPKFQSILLEDDFLVAKQIIDLLSIQKLEREIYCENTGLALYASNLGLKIIAGSLFNIANSFSVKALMDRMKLTGFIPSYDLDLSKTVELVFPDSVKLWLPVYYNYELMQSRQCLVGQLSNCNKAETNKECINNCNKEISFCGKHEESLIARKRPNFYSALYLNETLNLLKKQEIYDNQISVFLFDLRFEKKPNIIVDNLLKTPDAKNYRKEI